MPRDAANSSETGFVSPRGRRWLTTAQAAARLGVKPDTLYAYVSRGLLHPQRAPGGRASRFDPGEIERLAARGRRAAPAPPAGLVIETGLTAIAGGMLFYRGLPVTDLARDWSFEEVAEWLWRGAFPARVMWEADPSAVAAGGAAQAPLPQWTPPSHRLRVIAAAVAALQGGSGDRPEPALATARATARGLLAALVDGLPDLTARPPSPKGRGSERKGSDSTSGSEAAADAGPPSTVRAPQSPPGGSLAARLWARLCAKTPSTEMLAALNAAMVLLADHELAASTLAARAAASVRADLYAVVGAGLAVAGGAWHGGVAAAAEALIAAAEEAKQAAPALGERLGRGEAVPGFGHPLYPDGDPRAGLLLALVRAAVPPQRLAGTEAVLAAARGRGLPPPNVDFALGALARSAGMIPGAAEAIFAVARAAGWIAHALEEYERATVLRPGAVYTGPPPAGRT